MYHHGGLGIQSDPDQYGISRKRDSALCESSIDQAGWNMFWQWTVLSELYERKLGRNINEEIRYHKKSVSEESDKIETETDFLL